MTDDSGVGCGCSPGCSDGRSAIGNFALDCESAAKILSDGVIDSDEAPLARSCVEEDPWGSYAPSTLPFSCLSVGGT